MRLASLVYLATALPALAYFDAGSPDTPRHPDPLALGAMFCAGVVSGDMSALLPHLAPILARAVSGHGDVPWTGLAEPPLACAPSIVNGIDRAPVVLVALTYSLAGGGTVTETIQLDRTARAWLIDNVFYATGGNLRFRLSAP